MRYSVVVPIYKDGALAEDFCEALQITMRRYCAVDDLFGVVELIFVNDGSADDSLNRLLDLRKTFNFVKVIDLSRNFGQHVAIACGFREAKGDVIIRMNVDMQDHPDQIPVILDHMHRGKFDVTIGQYEKRKSPLVNRLTARFFFAFFRLMTGFDSPQNTSPLRALSRRYIDVYNSLTERTRFPQGLDHWLGFSPQYIRIEHKAREKGVSSYNFWSRLRLGLDGLLYFSERPLVIMTLSGLFLSFLGILLGILLIISKFLMPNMQPGYTSLATISLFSMGLQLFSLGIVGFYVGKIFKEVQNRPLYIVKDFYP